jgi:uncharacterized protein (TIGR02147 family)
LNLKQEEVYVVSLFDYLDYRQFLRALFEEKKREKAGFSHRSLMEKLSLQSPGHMLFIMQGKRRLTTAIALRLASYLKFSKREQRYLLALVRYSDAKTPAEKQYAFEELLQLRQHPSMLVTPDSYRFYGKWYYSAIRAVLDVEPITDDCQRLASLLRPAIAASQAKEAVELLLELGMIDRDETGVLHPRESAITTGDVWQGAVIHNLQRQFIELGKESLDRFDKIERDISNLTVTVSDQTFDLIRKKVTELRSQIAAMACAEQTPDKVLQVNIQIFPLSAPGKGMKS